MPESTEPAPQEAENATPQLEAAAATEEPQDVATLPDWAQKLIGGLRSENGDHRAKNKTLTEQLQTLQGANDELQATVALTDSTVKKREAELADAAITATREHLLYERGLPLKLASLIPGGDEDAMKAAADSLAELRGTTKTAPLPPDPALAAGGGQDDGAQKNAIARLMFGLDK